MSEAKEQLLDNIFEAMKPLVEKLNANSNENTDKLLACVNKLRAEFASGLEEMKEEMNKLKLNSGTGEY